MSRTPATPRTLPALFRLFLTKPSPRVIAAGFLTALAVRGALGGWSRHDLIIPAAILLAEPFTEWVIHVVLLHWKPRRVGRFVVDPAMARKHRAHHANPRDLDLALVPMRTLLVGPPLALAPAFLLMPAERAWMAAAAGLGMLLYYEWTHFLIHAPYRPRTAWFRRRSRNHRLHHFKNERYWFGVTTNAGDKVLRTNPPEESVPLSPTARTLGVPIA